MMMSKIQTTGWTCAIALILTIWTVMLCTVSGANVDRESWFNIRTARGYIQEKITLTGTEEDITMADGNTRVIYDYQTGFMTMRRSGDGVDKCLVSTFERRGLESPSSEQVTQEMTSDNDDQFSERDYYVDTSSEVDPAILSERSRDMCSQLPVHWMTEKPHTSSVDVHGRQKRECHRECSVQCSCCPRDCGVQCSIVCSW